MSAGRRGAQLRHVLAGQHQGRRTVGAVERELPALRDLDRIAGPEHAHVGHRAHRRQMFDRLMGRAVFAEPDRIVGHDVDDAGAHQRGKPHRRPRIVGEAEEGRAARRKAAVQEDAVHRRRHAVLADAVMHEAALRGLGLEIGGGLRLVVGRAREVGRTGQEFHRHRRDTSRRSPARKICGWRCSAGSPAGIFCAP